MATDCVVDGDYLGAYSRFFAEFVARVNPNDQLPVKVSAYDVDENELVGEIISVTLQYLNKTYCPPSLQSYIVHLVIQAIKSTCKKQPEICGLRQQEKTYAPLKLMQAVTNEVNEICRRYLDNSRLALLPPPSSTPQVTVGATRNARRKMEDRHMILHDLHTIFNIQDDTIVNYYAVFDGHGGQDAAAYCATHLHQYLIESVHYPTDPEAALRDAFLTTDAQFIAKSSTQKLNGGTTAVCALMLNKKLYIAWVGDSMASLVAHGDVKQLVNPHRPAREDENERIRNMGGVVVHCMGVLRVNGFLSISRAIGDVPYKPYVSGEPEVRCVSLDGTEDFLIIACDGLWDYVDQRTAALRVYRQVLQNPHDLKHVHQALLQSAKRAGSLDNITVIVVFLTPPVEIATRHSSLTHPAPNGLLLNNMDPNNPVSSNSGQFDVNAAFIKQQQQLIDADLHLDLDLNRDLNRVICGMARNGKHRDGDGNDDDYDYADLGPETDVDADEDAADSNRLSEALVTSSSSREFAPEESPMETEADNKGEKDGKEEEDLSRRDNANVCPVDSVINDVVSDDNRVRLSDRDVRCDERPHGNNDNDDGDDDDDDEGEARVESTTTTGTHTLVDDDESPPSPRVAKSLQHALIPEAENVADSEDSEDEWNYYRIDPNKKETVTTAESSEDKIEKQSTQDPESVLRGGSEVQSSKVEVDIKCEGSEEIPSLKLVNIDISYQKEPSESEKKDHGEKQADDDKEDMDFQLNPEAAEFVPLSPPLLNNRNALQDYPISGSPLKQTPAMDDILIPSQSEFEKEVCLRPKEIDEDFSSDEQQQHAARDNNLPDMDVSEISSTKAEVGDDSTARIASTTQWQTDISSQWSTTTRNDAGSDSEEYEIINRDNPMTMSLIPGDLEAAFEKGVDLNAVHDLNDSSDDAEHVNTPPRSPGGPCVNEDVRSYTPPLLDDKEPIDLLCASSTPHPADNQSPRSPGGPCMNEDTPPSSDDEEPIKFFTVKLPSSLDSPPANIPWTRTVTSESDEAKDAVSVLKAESSPTEQLGVTLLADDSPTQELITSPLDHSQSTDSSEVDNNKSTDSSEVDNNKSLLPSKLNYAKSSLPEKSTREDCGENVKLMEGSDEIQNEGGQTCLFGITGYRECAINEKLQDTAVELPKKMDPTKHSNANNSEMKKDIPELYRFCRERPANFSSFSETERKYETAEMIGKPLKQPIINSEETFYVENPQPQQSDWADFYKTDKSMLLGMDEGRYPDCNDVYDPDMKNRFAFDLKKQDNNQPDKSEENDIVVKPDSTNPSDSKEESTVAEKQIQPEGQTHQTDVSSACTLMTIAETEQKLIEIAVAQIREVCEKQQMASEDIPTSKEEETKPRETAKAASPEGVAKTDESKEQITGTAEEEATVKAAVASTVKAKATTTATKRPTKTTSTTKVTATSTTKTATKITPTSPSKAIGTMTSRVTTTSSPVQSAIARKSIAARPKQLTDGSTKVTASSSAGKVGGIKTTTSSNKTASTTTAATMKTSISPRVATTKSRTTSSTAVASSSKLSTATTSTEKKSTINKVAAAKPASTKTTTARTITLLVKSSPLTTAKTSTTSNVTSKPRSTSAGTTTKTSVTTSKQSTTGSTSSRPRTAPPTSGGAIKPRENSAKTSTAAKSPLIDKQSKETVNKQISRSSAVATSSSKTASRAPASLVGSTAAKSRLSLGKSLGKSSENAISPIKKPSLTPRAASRTASSTPGTKSAPLNESPKVVQNGIPESRVVDVTSRAAVITATSDKPGDDVPRKDASPVNVPTDNQLLVTID